MCPTPISRPTQCAFWSLVAVALLASARAALAAEEENKAAAAQDAVAAADRPTGIKVKLPPGPVGSPDDFDDTLKKYVRGDYFDYKALKQNKSDLDRFHRFLRWQAQADLSAMPRNDQIAFYINAYNACGIKAVLDHYPVHTPLDIDGFFDKLQFQVAGEWLKIGGEDGDSIEYDRLIENYKDMRAHFAVVCADRGCLPLKSGAYQGSSLDKDLEAAAGKFVGDERQFKIDLDKREVQISKIFEWYGPKFLNDPQRPVGGERPELYLLHWIKDPQTRKLLESGDYTLKVIEWSWTLNEK